ncbi:MAG: hypothetical protein V3V35_05800 [Dehalococcoidia bacterium]
MLGTIRQHMWIGGVVMGVGLLAIGTLFVAKGLEARAEIRAGLAAEEVMTSKDAQVPGIPVRDATAARMQEAVIKEHTLGRYGPYSQMSREDPNRDVYLKGLTLRNALNTAVMGFGVADMAIGVGAIVLLLGAGTLGAVVPLLYWARQPRHEIESTAKVTRGLTPSMATP